MLALCWASMCDPVHVILDPVHVILMCCLAIAPYCMLHFDAGGVACTGHERTDYC